MFLRILRFIGWSQLPVLLILMLRIACLALRDWQVHGRLTRSDVYCFIGVLTVFTVTLLALLRII